jgi:hypothetical protein
VVALPGLLERLCRAVERVADAQEQERPTSKRKRERLAAEGAELLTLRQTDALLGARRGTAAGLVNRGQLGTVQVGGKERVPRAGLDELLAGTVEPAKGRGGKKRRAGGTASVSHAAAIKALRISDLGGLSSGPATYH